MRKSSLIEKVIPEGMLVDECSLPGESRADGAVPAHPSGIQLSRDRFLLLYTTRGFRGRDDEWSGVYRLLADSWTGPLVREGYIAQTTNSWPLFDDDRRYVRQIGHPTAFGVPKGALIKGRRVAHENHFMVMWRQVARLIDRHGHVHWPDADRQAAALTACAMEMQFRLNDAGDDIEITREPRLLRQQGCPEGQVCQWPEVGNLIKGYVPAVPLNDDCSEWLDVNTAASKDQRGEDACYRQNGYVLPSRYRWNADAGTYEWVASGRLWGPDLFEGSAARYGDSFVLHARMLGFEGMEFQERGEYTRVAAWNLTTDPMHGPYAEARPREQPNWYPTSVFSLPDGSIARLGNAPQCKYRRGRGPLYLVRIDPSAGFQALEHVQLREVDQEPIIDVPGHVYLDFPKLLPHTGGREQIVVHRVQTSEVWRDPATPFQPPPQALAANGCGLYYIRLRYREELPATWSFDP